MKKNKKFFFLSFLVIGCLFILPSLFTIWVFHTQKHVKHALVPSSADLSIKEKNKDSLSNDNLIHEISSADVRKKEEKVR